MNKPNMKTFYSLWILFVILVSFSSVSSNNSYYYLTRAKPELIPLLVKPVYIDKDYSEEDKAIIKKSLDEFNFVLNGMIVFQVKDDKFDMDLMEINDALNNNGLIILKINSQSYLIHDKSGTLILGWMNKLNGNLMYIVRDRLDNEFFHSVILHELGHALGAEHRPEGLMEAVSAKPYPCIDGETALQISAVQMIPFEEMNYCVWNN